MARFFKNTTVGIGRAPTTGEKLDVDGTALFEGRIDINDSGGLEVLGTKVVGAQGATVSDPTGGATIDLEARTAIIAIIDRLQAHGLVA